MKNVVSLIETQGHLRELSLPGLEASSSILPRDYLRPSHMLSHIHEFTIALSHNQTCDGEIYEIVRSLRIFGTYTYASHTIQLMQHLRVFQPISMHH